MTNLRVAIQVGCPRGRLGGFSLVEVMLALGVLAIGMVSVASIFPVAILQEKRASDDTMGVIVGGNVIALLQVAGASDPLFAVETEFAPLPEATDDTHSVPPTVLDLYRQEYDDPTYDYRLAYRRPSAGDPVEIAVFVFRKDADTTTDTEVSPSTISIGVSDAISISDTNAEMTGGSAPDYPRHVRRQIILAEDTTTTSEAFVMRVIKEGEVASAPRVTTDRMLFLFDDSDGDDFWDPDKEEEIVRAVAVVVGRI